MDLIDSPSEQQFLDLIRVFLARESIDAASVDLQIKSVQGLVNEDDTWRPLATVYVDEKPGGGYVRKLVFEKDYWFDSAREDRFVHHRVAKLMWHEIHHLKYFPVNLRRAHDLRKKYPAKAGITKKAWQHQWVRLLEPLEEMAAELDSVKRYKTAFGPLPDDLLFDSRADMRKHAARYQNRLAELLAHAKRPAQIRKQFPSSLPVDEDGNILAEKPIQ